MDRRGLLAWVGGLGAAEAAGAVGIQGRGGLNPEGSPVLLAQAAAPAHDHAAMSATPSAPSKYGALIAPYQDCIRAALTCISHCQQLLAQGDKSLGTCLKTALDTEVVCQAVLKLATLKSPFTPALARQSVSVMQACVEACKEHVGHHAECKACHDACLTAIDAAKGIA